MYKSRREAFEGWIWLVTSFNIKGTFKSLCDVLTVLSDVTDAWNPTFEVFHVIKSTVDKSIDRSYNTSEESIDTEFASLDQLINSFAKISNWEVVADWGADCPPAAHAVEAAQVTSLGGSPLIIAWGKAACGFGAAQADENLVCNWHNLYRFISRIVFEAKMILKISAYLFPRANLRGLCSEHSKLSNHGLSGWRSNGKLSCFLKPKNKLSQISNLKMWSLKLSPEKKA